MGCEASLRAVTELEEVLSFIDERSPQGAQHQTRIQVMTALPLEHPQVSYPTSKNGLRRMVVHPYPI